MSSVTKATPPLVVLAPVELLIFQATPFCNIACDYCYLPDRADKSQIQHETIEKTCRQLRARDLIVPSPTVLWHAGEPLVLPVSFYRQAFNLIAEILGSKVEHRIQTNATLLSPEWIGLFREWQVGVGVSLDGPAWLHDRNRKTRSGRSTHQKTLDGVRLLLQAGITPRVICVVTATTLGAVDELFWFFEELGIERIGFNIDEPGGPYQTSSHPIERTHLEFKEFLLRYFQLVHKHKSRQIVREFERGMKYVFAPKLGPATEAVPISNLTVGYGGDFSTLSPELHGLAHPAFGSFNLGNVNDAKGLASLHHHPRLLAMLQSIDVGRQICRDCCSYFEICGGGMPASKLAQHATFEVGETLACRFKRQAVAAAAAQYLLNVAALPSVCLNRS